MNSSSGSMVLRHLCNVSDTLLCPKFLMIIKSNKGNKEFSQIDTSLAPLVAWHNFIYIVNMLM